MLEVISLISLIIIICMLRRITEILPSVFASILRWKESINIDASMKSSRDRDITALVLIIPLCLTLHKFNIPSLKFMSAISSEAAFGVTLGVFCLYFLFRVFTSRVFLPNRNRNSRVTDCSERTFFIILAISIMACSWILALLNIDESAIKITILWLSAAIYLLYLSRKFQIFRTSHSIFTTFLYLCALEIIPTGTLVVSVIIF